MRNHFTTWLLSLMVLFVAACGARQVRTQTVHAPPKAEPAPIVTPAAALEAVPAEEVIAPVPDEVAEATFTGREAVVEERIKEADRDIRNAERILARKSTYRPDPAPTRVAKAITTDDFKVDRSGFDRFAREFSEWYATFLAEFRRMDRRVAALESSDKPSLEDEKLAMIEIEPDEGERGTDDEVVIGVVLPPRSPPSPAPVLPDASPATSTFDKLASAYGTGIALAVIAGLVLGLLLSRRKPRWEGTMVVTEIFDGKPVATHVVRPPPPVIPMKQVNEDQWYADFEQFEVDESQEPEPPLPPDIVSGETETPPPRARKPDEAYPKVIYEAPG